MIFRLSQKLAARIKAGKLSEMPLDANPLADWSANLFVADRTQYVILSNTPSLYSCVMLAKGITSAGQFTERTSECIREFMEKDYHGVVYRRHIAFSIAAGGFAKTLNRTVTGSMNELIKFAELWLAEADPPNEVGFKLNESLLSALATETSGKYGTPNEAFKELVRKSRK